MPKSMPRSGRPFWRGEPDERAEPLAVLGLVGGRTLLVVRRSRGRRPCRAAPPTRRGGGTPRSATGANPLTRGAPVGREAEERASRPSRSGRGARGSRGCDAYWSACTSRARVTPCSSAIGQRAPPSSRASIEICTRAIGKPSLAAALIWRRHVLDQLVLVQQPVAVDADVGVDRERRGHQPDLGDEVAEPAGEARRRSPGSRGSSRTR